MSKNHRLDPLLVRAANRPPMDAEEEREVLRRATSGDPAARDRLVESNLRWITKVARSFAGQGVPFEDLVHEGCLGLLMASLRFDHRNGARFITYAHWWIRKLMLDALDRDRNSVKVSQNHRKAMREAGAIRRDLQSSLGRNPRADEVSAALQRSPRQLHRRLGMNLREVRLDQPDSEGRTREIEDPDGRLQRDPVDELIRNETTGLLREAVAQLTEREREVIEFRYGLSGRPPMVLREVGRRLDLSRERVRQIEDRAKCRLRALILRRQRPTFFSRQRPAAC